mmetsp:Transcript_77059/g.121685  ORF Transcript_77059/g.121685 Transcript_77059/m.121685 type:complete len:223 (+) Transcript_77059:139-807(+)
MLRLLAAVVLDVSVAATLNTLKLRHASHGLLSVSARKDTTNSSSVSWAIDCLSEEQRRRRKNATAMVDERDSACNSYANPTVWGPPTWFFLHSLTLALPEQVPADKQASVKSLMYDLQNVLPCPSCGMNLKKHMEIHPVEPHLATRSAMVKWMIDIHNMVNKDVGNKEMDEDAALQEYSAAFRGESPKGYLEVIGRSAADPRSTVSLWLFGFAVVISLRAIL